MQIAEGKGWHKISAGQRSEGLDLEKVGLLSWIIYGFGFGIFRPCLIRWFSRSSDHAIASKARARKSASASADGAKLDKPIIGDEPMIDASEKDSGPKGDDHNSINKLVVRDRKLILTVTKPQQQTNTNPSNSESSKVGGRESSGVCKSEEDLDNNKEAKNVEWSTNMEANEIVDLGQVIKAEVA